MGGGKSLIGTVIFLQIAAKYSGLRFAIIRKNMTVLKRTTYQTFKKVAQVYNIAYKENQQEMFWDIGSSRIYFVEADESKDRDFDKFKGLELTAAMIDEANEVSERAFNILMARVGRENPNGLLAFILLTCNPSDNWVKSRFYEPWTGDKLKEPYFFIQALAKDNPFLEPDYIKALEDLPEAEYQRYVLGNWAYGDDPNQLIKYEWIKSAVGEMAEVVPNRLGIDVAREGNDRTVFCFGTENAYLSKEVFRQQDTITTAQLAIERIKEKSIGASAVIVDVVGVGGGVVDYMKNNGFNVYDFNSGSSPDTELGHLQFKNKRAQAYWNMREGLEQGRLKLVDDGELFKELVNIKYFVKDKTIQIESKQELKRRLGYSPDIADALSLMFYKAPEEKYAEIDFY